MLKIQIGDEVLIKQWGKNYNYIGIVEWITFSGAYKIHLLHAPFDSEPTRDYAYCNHDDLIIRETNQRK